MVHGKGQGRHQGEHLGLGLINQMEGKEAMGRRKRKIFVVKDRKVVQNILNLRCL